MSNKKPIYKQWWLWVIVGVVVLALIGSIGKRMMPTPEEAESYLSAVSDLVSTTDRDQDQDQDQETTETQAASTTAATPTESAEQTNASDDQREDLQAAFADAMGGALVTFSKTVRNDVTGNWRLAKLASSEDIVDHAVEYYKAYISDDKEVHFVINFTLNTTACLNVYGDQFFIDEYARVDGEEHDAKMLPAGEHLKSYMIHLDTGEVEDLDTVKNESGDSVDFKSLETDIQSALPSEYYSEKWSYVTCDASWDGLVTVSIQLDIGKNDSDLALSVAGKCYDISKQIVENADVQFESVSVVVVNNGAPIGIYSSDNGKDFNVMRNGKMSQISLP